MKDNAVLDKSFAFSVRIVKIYKYLTEQKKEYVLSKQLLRCGTSIGANVTEAQRAQSKPDFVSKMSIALKEAYEVEYWLLQQSILRKMPIRVCATIMKNS